MFSIHLFFASKSENTFVLPPPADQPKVADENNFKETPSEISLVNQEAFSFLNSSNTPGPEASPLDLGNPESND